MLCLVGGAIDCINGSTECWWVHQEKRGQGLVLLSETVKDMVQFSP